MESRYQGTDDYASKVITVENYGNQCLMIVMQQCYGMMEE